MRNQRIISIGALLTVLFLSGAAGAHDLTEVLAAIANGDHRSAEHKARNKYRHPAETLAFFGIREHMTVAEISPGGSGWYTEILAPFLREKGTLYAGSYDPEAEEDYYRRNAKRFDQKLAAAPEIYDHVITTIFDPPHKLEAAPPASADLVLTFRNLHNWMEDGDAHAAMKGMYRITKPGGVLGLVQHRGAPSSPQDPAAESGYIREDLVIELAESVGFRYLASSEINANPKDSKDYPEGVWTLPPAFELEDVDRAKYSAIGESDRMTLKFVKPE